MKAEKEVRICDVCNEFFQIWWENGTNSIGDPDYKVSYLGHNIDLCPCCYQKLVNLLCKKTALVHPRNRDMDA